ncbi:MAG: hypothetical protein EZS28_039242 [Streblomastix strix]|uniref:Uncharacterized protein n=1 Tax=Streblomastix strix TaxID=222440 RepID=A0A5J4U5G0_9EUKA|nr:MAG: hypothetical protein EZS28_039242 [Streblomastix strix]
MVILHSLPKVVQYGCMIAVEITVEIQFLIKQLLPMMLLHQLTVELELQELQMSIEEEIISIHCKFLMFYQVKILLLTVNTIPNSDSADGSYGTVDSYARNDHSQPINVQINASIVSVVNGVGNNGSSAYYSRHDHIHPQQLTYDGDITATKLIKSGGLQTELLYANDDTTAISDNDSHLVKKTGKTLQAVQGVLRHSGDEEESEDDDDYQTRGQIYQFYVNKAQTVTIIVESTGSSTIQLGCSRLLNTGQIAGQWTTYTTPSNYTTNRLGFKISLASDSDDNTRGLQISPDGNTLSFNRSVIAGTGATNGASNGSVNYSAGNPILWGVNSTDPIG